MDRYQDCGCGCGRRFELVNWDSAGADYSQPEGFYDVACSEWYANACGDPKTRRCERCQALDAVDVLRDALDALKDDLLRDDAVAARGTLLKVVAAEHHIGRRIRILAAKQQRPCDPKTCDDCRQVKGAA